MKFCDDVSHGTNRSSIEGWTGKGDKYAITQASKACCSDIACWLGTRICVCV